MKTRFIMISFLGVAAFAAGAAVFLWAPLGKTDSVAASLRGFAPGARIAYKIAPADAGPEVAGEGIADANGQLAIFSSKLQTLASPPVTYSFSVREKEDSEPLNISLVFSAEEEKVSVLGDGFDNFTPVSVNDKLNTKADWAGYVRGEGAWEKEDGSFEVAFFANNLASDAPRNPKIIEIMTAPGGGGPPLPFPTPRPDLNIYANLYCETVLGQQVPSTCRPPAMGPTLISTGPGATHMQQVNFNIMNNYVTALIMMGEQLSSVMITHTSILGPFLDAKQLLETQRLVQQMNARAHKDYHPSETMCQFGSFIKSVPQADQKIDINKRGLNTMLMGAYSNLEHMAGAEGYAIDIEARIRQFRRVYCDPWDNNNGLEFMCEHDQDRDLSDSTIGDPVPTGIGPPRVTTPPPARNSPRMNKDIEYTRLMEMPLTLNVNFADNVGTQDEEDVYALARNLYWPRALDPGPHLELAPDFREFLDARKIFAMTNIAHNSYLHIAAMKAHTDEGLGADAGWNFMKSLMRNFGLSDPDIDELLGEFPSYYAQMEVLTKKIYEQPDFYTNLMDTPTNVKRIGLTMDAIRIMQQRDMLESMHRQEMINSMMVEQDLAPSVERINSGITTAIKDMNISP